MKYPLVRSAEYRPTNAIKTTTYNSRYFSLGTLNTPHLLKLMQRMKTGAPELYNTIHTDPLVKQLITNFDADIIVPMKR